MTKLAVIVYHKNINFIYPTEWVEKFKQSILGQTYKDFQIYELNYGGGLEQIFETSYFESFQLSNFAHAMNYLLDKVFAAGYNCAANVNCDDWFCEQRFSKQIPYIEAGYDIVSSNFALVKDDQITLVQEFDKLDVHKELAKNHNIICHPSIIMSAAFYKENKYDPSLIPLEDMELWKQGLFKGFKFKIVPDVLCYHRLHPESVGHKLKEE